MATLGVSTTEIMQTELGKDFVDARAKAESLEQHYKENEIGEQEVIAWNSYKLKNGKSPYAEAIEKAFNKMLERSDSHLEENDVYYTDLLDDKYFVQHNRISRIPGRWLSEWVKKKYGANYMKLLKKYMIDHGWEFKTAGYLNSTYKCFVKEKEPK